MYISKLSLSADNIVSEVCRITQNAAKERGDGLHFATADNTTIIYAFIIEAIGRLDSVLARYGISSTTNESTPDWAFSLKMPNNWPKDNAYKMQILAMTFFTNYCVAKWFGLTGTGEAFMRVAQSSIEDMERCLEQRLKP